MKKEELADLKEEIARLKARAERFDERLITEHAKLEEIVRQWRE